MEAVIDKKLSKPLYTKGEEIFNAVSHIVGGAIGLAVWAVLLYLTWGNAVRMLAVSAFGFGIVVLYTMSALYHFLPSGRGKRVFRIFDHCTIFLLIAGTYTPYCLIPLYNTAMGWAVLAVEWGIAVAGITMNAIAMNNLVVKSISMVFYVVGGWLAVAFLPMLLKTVSLTCVLLLLFGGIAYTVGIGFFAFGKKVRYFHSVWHLFTILGTVLQFASIVMML